MDLDKLADDLYVAWGKYQKGFGVPVHGTRVQLRAMLEFLPKADTPETRAHPTTLSPCRGCDCDGSPLRIQRCHDEASALKAGAQPPFTSHWCGDPACSEIPEGPRDEFLDGGYRTT